MRFESKKRVLELEECCHPFKVTFNEPNCEEGVFISVNGNKKILPVGVEITLTRDEWLLLKNINNERGFLPQSDYDPFKIED